MNALAAQRSNLLGHGKTHDTELSRADEFDVVGPVMLATSARYDGHQSVGAGEVVACRDDNRWPSASLLATDGLT